MLEKTAAVAGFLASLSAREIRSSRISYERGCPVVAFRLDGTRADLANVTFAHIGGVWVERDSPFAQEVLGI